MLGYCSVLNQGKKCLLQYVTDNLHTLFSTAIPMYMYMYMYILPYKITTLILYKIMLDDRGMIIPYSWKFSIGENFQSVRPRAEGSKLNSVKIRNRKLSLLKLNSITCAHACAAVHDGSAIFLTSRSLLSEDVATTVSLALAALTASKPYWSVVFLVGSIGN